MIRSLKKFLVLCTLAIISVAFYSMSIHIDMSVIFRVDTRNMSTSRYKMVNYQKKDPGMKYILFWEASDRDRGFSASYSNNKCSFTSNQSLFKSTSEFDAIIFNPFKKIPGQPYPNLPSERSPHQFYILYGREYKRSIR